MPGSKRMRALLWDMLCQAALCGLGFLTIYFFAAGTSPIRPDEYQWDSGLFQVVGKLWADGLTPYVDIFDHKGPLLFFVQKLAYECANPRIALYVLESLLVSLSLVLCYQTLRLKWGRGVSLAGSVLMLVFWLPLMEYGNLCETHSMPWLMLALYLQMRYFTSENPKHPPLYALLYGLCFGANLMIRPNNGVLIAVVTLMITIQLAVKGEWKNILFNAFALIAGVLAAAVPFVAYFASRGALDAFIYATWTFNLIYAESLEFLLDFQSLRNVLFFITPSLWCMLMCLVCCIRRRWTMAGVHLLAALATLYVTLSGIGYSHYFMLHAPLIPLCLYTMRCLDENRLWKWGLAAVCIGFALVTVRTTLPYARANLLTPPSPQQQAREQAYDDMAAALCSHIPAEERDQVAVCGLLVTDAELFLKTDLHPVGRYCFLMEWHSRADNEIRRRFVNTLKSGEAKWLIYREGGSGEDILQIMDECYTLEASYPYEGIEYMLYRWKEDS